MSTDIAWVEKEIEKSQELENALRNLIRELESNFPVAVLKRNPSWLSCRKILQDLDNDKRKLGNGFIDVKK